MDPDAPTRTDPERFEAVAEIARKLGMRVSGIVVGDIRVQMAQPWPSFEPAPLANGTGPEAHGEDQGEYSVDITKAGEDDKIKELRKRAIVTFGRGRGTAMSAKELLAMDGVL